MTAKTLELTLSEIENAQAGLRDSIERARDLAEESERLVLKHRIEAANPLHPTH
jgi:hypothetical protein